ncbi:MAG: hypothetical protein MUE41_06130, partial [Gemmatimonadaceae bacterium]|nr:hypothetical protein [Gemmatimonadaceae bacterium]
MADAAGCRVSDAHGAPWIAGPSHGRDRALLGGKAAALAIMGDAGLPVLPWRVVTPAAYQATVDAGAPGVATSALAHAIEAAVDALLLESPQQTHAPMRLLAVRSSAVDEDGAAHSFAGQFESYLAVTPADVVSHVEAVWRSAKADRVRAYRAEHGLGDVAVPAVLLQPMLDPDAAGVAFSADATTGRRAHALISATRGLGASLVSGEETGESCRVDLEGTVFDRVASTEQSVQRPREGGGITTAPISTEQRHAPVLTDAQARAVAALARRCAEVAGSPQDIEWAVVSTHLVLLQSRPITTLDAMPDPDGEVVVWDNSNITESYGGVTTPLTFSFARGVYAVVYRQFCRLLNVPERVIAAHDATFSEMLGLHRGRVYYHLSNWYRVLALLPGYALNRGFMEQMMGVREPLPPAMADALAAATGDVTARTVPDRVRAWWAVVRSLAALLVEWRRLPARARHFQARLDAALAPPAIPLTEMSSGALVAHYRDLERQLLLRWDAPLVNDFFAMIAFGVLGKLCGAWLGDANGTLRGALVSGGGDIISAEPARRLHAMARRLRAHPALIPAFHSGDPVLVADALRKDAGLDRELTTYLERFGDRCLEELKLETETLGDDPRLLYRSLARLAERPEPIVLGDEHSPSIDAERQVAQAPLPAWQRWLFERVRREARER